LTAALEYSNLPIVKHLSDLTAILVAHAPRQQAARVLELLVARTRAAAGALLAVQDGQLVLFGSSRALEASRIAHACALWNTHRETLERGVGAITEAEHVLAGVRDDERLIAVLYLDRPEAFDPVAVSTFNVALAKAVQLDKVQPAADIVDEWIPGPEHGRERLSSMLQRNEGNIARVARLMGVTRRTIYLRMQRYGIPRIKVPKSNTPRQKKAVV
jgi:hypothetical protein